MKPKLPAESPDARTVVPGREVTYHEVAPDRLAARSVKSGPGAANDMRVIVINVLTGVRARWALLSVKDKQGLVEHLRSVADLIEKSIGGVAP